MISPAPLPPSSALYARLTPDQRAAVERAAYELARAIWRGKEGRRA